MALKKILFPYWRNIFEGIEMVDFPLLICQSPFLLGIMQEKHIQTQTGLCTIHLVVFGVGIL